MPNQTLIDFENLTGLGSVEAACVLRIGYATYAAYRNGRRELPEYCEGHIEMFASVKKLSAKELKLIIEKRLNHGN